MVGVVRKVLVDLCEKVVLLEFVMRGYSVSYFKENYEIDFIVNGIPIQVAYEITYSNYSRETTPLKRKGGLLVAFRNYEQVKEEGFKVVPADRFLLDIDGVLGGTGLE